MGNMRKLDAQRRAVAFKTQRAWRDVPHVSFIYEPDATEFYSEFKALKAAYGREGIELGMNTVLIKAVVEALKAAPLLNSALRFDDRSFSGSIETFDEISVDIPWLLPDGRMMALTAANLKHKPLRGIAAQILDLRARVPAPTLTC